ncbi:MAG: hypothetical protein ABSG88_18970, partial [Bradyrhizobium sp.]
MKRSDAEISVYYLSLFQLLTLIGPFTCWTLCWTFRSTLDLARLPLKTPFATMEIREALVVTPVSA